MGAFRGRFSEGLLVAAVLLLAAVLRMDWPGLTEFKGDEARLVAIALEMAQFETFPLRGISSSVGFPNFPASVWIYALPLMAWRHVMAPLLFTGLANVLAVAGTWWLVRRLWGPRAALAAALLFAVSPWAVVHSRKIWAQNLLPPLVVGWAISAFLTFVEDRPRFLALHVFLLALAVQVHLAALSLLAPSVLFLILFRRRVRWKPLLAGAAIALLTMAPFAIYLSERAGIVGTIGEMATGGSVSFNLLPWRYALLLSTGSEIHSLAGPQQFRTYLQRLPPMWPVYGLWLALMATGVLLALRQVIRGARATGGAHRTQPPAAIILLIWLVAPPLFFMLAPFELALHYLLPILPAPFILAGIAVEHVFRRFRGVGLPLVLAGIVGAGLQIFAWATLLGVVATQATPGGFGTPLTLQLEAASAARDLAQQTGAGEVLIAGRGADPGEIEFAAVYDVLLWDLPHRFVDAQNTTLFPATPSVVLLDAGLNEEQTALYREAATTRREAPLRPGEGALHILTVPARSAPAPQTRLPEQPQFANYVKLLGYSAAPGREQGSMEWLMWWRTADSPLGARYHFFNHLLDAAGQRVAQADGAAFDPAQWRQGDVVVSRFRLDGIGDLQGPLTMRVGMYVFPTLENVPVLDVAGNAASDAVEIGIAAERITGP